MAAFGSRKGHFKLSRAGNSKRKRVEPGNWTACSAVQAEIWQVQGGDQPPLPTNGNSFVARSMPKVLHTAA